MSNQYTDFKRKQFSRSKAIKAQGRLAKVIIILTILITSTAIYTAIIRLNGDELANQAEVLTVEELTELTKLEVFGSAYLKVNCNEQILKRINTIRISGSRRDDISNSTFTLMRKRPYQMHLTVKTPRGSITSGLDHGVAWRRIREWGQDDVVFELEGKDAELFLGKQRNFFDPIITALISDDATIESIQAVSGEDYAFLKVVVKVEPLGELIELMVDPQTMLTKTELTKLADGRIRTNVYTDYRDIDGVLIPFKTESILDDGTDKNSITIKAAAINMVMFPSIFKIPEPHVTE
jgi:hypothetical protein